MKKRLGNTLMSLTQLPMKVREQKIKIVPINQVFYKKLQHQFE